MGKKQLYIYSPKKQIISSTPPGVRETQLRKKIFFLHQIGRDKEKINVRKKAFSHTIGEQNSFGEAALAILIKI